MMKKVVQRVLEALPKPPYADAFYWDKVYVETFQGRGAIEWGASPAQLLHYQWSSEDGALVHDAKLEDHAGKGEEVLVVGCGNSRLSEDMALAGWDPTKMTSVDFSATSIQQASARARGSGDKRLGALNYVTGDCRKLHEMFPASSFDSAVDKGLLDALYCSSIASEAIPATARSVLRVLRPGGRYISLHSGGFLGIAPPANLQEYMDDDRWLSLETRRLVPWHDGLYLWIWTKRGAGRGSKAKKSSH